MQESEKKVPKRISKVSTCVKNLVPSNWGQVIASRSEGLIWSTIKSVSGDAHDKAPTALHPRGSRGLLHSARLRSPRRYVAVHT